MQTQKVNIELLHNEPEEYFKLYEAFIANNRNDQGEIISDKREERLVMELKEGYDSLGNNEYVYLVESLVMYDKFFESQDLKDFINFTKRFVIAVENEPYKLKSFYPYWEKAAQIDNVESLEQWAKLNIINLVSDYVWKVESDAKNN